MPVPLTNYDDLDIRAGVIEGGGSVPSAFSWEDLVNAADWSKFHPSYLDGATDKSGIVHDGQFRGYPYTPPCADPILSLIYTGYDYDTGYIHYIVRVTNKGSRTLSVSHSHVRGPVGTSIFFIDGADIYVSKRMANDTTINVYFTDNGTCPDSNTVGRTITAFEGWQNEVELPDPASINTNKHCVANNGTDFAVLTGTAPSGGTVTWFKDGVSMGVTGFSIAVYVPGIYTAFVVSGNRWSFESASINIGVC